MEHQQVSEIIEQLRSKALNTVEIKKEDFLMFREILVKQTDFKHFRGVANHGGSIVYEYKDEPRV